MYEQKEIVLLPFPYSDLSAIKQRPALIISNKKLNNSDDRICCLITSNPESKGIEIKNSDFEESNLPFQSWIRPHRIFTVDKSVIKKKLCKINNDFHDRIINQINQYLKRQG